MNHKFLSAKNKTEKNKTLTGLLKTFSFFVVWWDGKGEKEKERETERQKVWWWSISESDMPT